LLRRVGALIKIPMSNLNFLLVTSIKT